MPLHRATTTGVQMAAPVPEIRDTPSMTSHFLMVDKVICHNICWKHGVSNEDLVKVEMIDFNL
jgi:hypothetical protein